MSHTPRIFLESTVFKFSATKQLRFIPYNKEVRNWYGRVVGFIVNKLDYVNPNDRITNPDLKTEADLLPMVAGLAKDSKIHGVTHVETEFETWGLPKMDSESGRFYGAPIEHVNAPIKYSRIFIGAGLDSKQLQRNFLLSITNARFKELQKVTGAYQGKRPANSNQLLDAFQIWCAEHSECDYFLTLDFKLIRVVMKHHKRPKRLVLVKPSTLLDELGNA